MTSRERARTFLETHLGQIVSMTLLEELSKSFDDHRDAQRKAQDGLRETLPLRAVADVDEEVDDDATE